MQEKCFGRRILAKFRGFHRRWSSSSAAVVAAAAVQQQVHHREENNHHRPDQQQEVRGNFAFIELRRKTRVGLEIFTREGGNFRDTSAWRYRYHSLDRKRVPWNSSVCIIFVRIERLRRIIVRVSGSSAWSGWFIVSSSTRFNSWGIWQLVSSLAQSAGGFDIAENFTICVFKVSIPAGRGRESNRLTREDVAKRSIWK